uniref:Uncharacterized protein n=1 Tax=Oryzias melastigma TaxID=30732 RepID=A0A3B3BI48_ORYME
FPEHFSREVPRLDAQLYGSFLVLISRKQAQIALLLLKVADPCPAGTPKDWVLLISGWSIRFGLKVQEHNPI